MNLKEATKILNKNGYKVVDSDNKPFLTELSRYNKQSFKVIYGDPLGDNTRMKIISAFSWHEAVDIAEEMANGNSILSIAATL